jgi:hypothetical protein
MADRNAQETSVFRQGLLEALRQETEKLKASQEALDEKRRLEESLLERAADRDRNLYPEKLRLARDIFCRLDKLRRDSELRTRIGKLKERAPENFSKGLFINGWRWAHTPDAGGACNWSRTYLRESGGKPELYYWAGYKWFGNGPHIYAQTPEELADRFSYEYLRQLRQSFEDGTVYETIKNWHIGDHVPSNGL